MLRRAKVGEAVEDLQWVEMPAQGLECCDPDDYSSAGIRAPS